MLTFAEAKLQYNPDPTWQPTRNSSEYYEILTLMEHSGVDFNTSIKPKILTTTDTFKDGSFAHPISNPRPPTTKKYLSKKDFLAITSNNKAFKDGQIPKEQTVLDVPQILVSKATLAALKTQIQNVVDAENRMKKMSKQEVLNLADNKEYIRQHILLNNK